MKDDELRKLCSSIIREIARGGGDSEAIYEAAEHVEPLARAVLDLMAERNLARQDLALSHAQHADVTGRMAAETEQAERERDAAIRDRAEAHERAGYCADQMVVAQAERDAALAVLREIERCLSSDTGNSVFAAISDVLAKRAACLREREGKP